MVLLFIRSSQTTTHQQAISEVYIVFRIDPEFKKLIPALVPEEYSQLETNIVDDGCRDPLTVWEEEELLLDGHNRFDICKRYGMEYEVFYVSLPSRQAAVNWIINNQLGRRNVTPEQASYLRGKRYNMEKAEHSTGRPKKEDQNDPDFLTGTAADLSDSEFNNAATAKVDAPKEVQELALAATLERLNSKYA